MEKTHAGQKPFCPRELLACGTSGFPDQEAHKRGRTQVLNKKACGLEFAPHCGLSGKLQYIVTPVSSLTKQDNESIYLTARGFDTLSKPWSDYKWTLIIIYR